MTCDPAKMRAPFVPASVARGEMEIDVRAARREVWAALTTGVDRWWLADFRMAAGSRRVVIEAVPGGRWFEESDGGGLLWGTVLVCDPERTLTLGGLVAPPWGASVSMLSVQLEDHRDGTRLRVSLALVGDITEAGLAEMTAGWRMLFENGLKAHVESAQAKR